jgi:hypothetical protein
MIHNGIGASYSQGLYVHCKSHSFITSSLLKTLHEIESHGPPKPGPSWTGSENVSFVQFPVDADYQVKVPTQPIQDISKYTAYQSQAAVATVSWQSHCEPRKGRTQEF